MATNYEQILQQLLSERAKLDAAIDSMRELAQGSTAKRRGRPPKNNAASSVALVSDKRRKPWSAERRKKMSEAQKKRFASAKKTTGKGA